MRKDAISKVMAGVSAAVVLAASQPAQAASAAVTFEHMAANIARAASGFNNLISMVCWIAGAGFGVAGIFRTKAHVDRPGEVPLKDGLVRLAVGGCLLAFPFIMQAMQGSISNGYLSGLHASTLSMDSTSTYQ